MRIKLCQKGKAGSFVPAWRYVNYDYKDAICSNTLVIADFFVSVLVADYEIGTGDTDDP